MKDKQGRLEWDPKRREEEASRSFTGSPPAPMEAVDRSRKAMALAHKPEPTVIDAGLRKGDELIFSWVSLNSLSLKGCELAVRRSGKVLNWATGGFGRDPGGKRIYLSYVKSRDEMASLTSVVAEASGYEVRVIKEIPNFLHLEVATDVEADSHRLMSGDNVHFCPAGRRINVTRAQITVDMNLYNPGDRIGTIFAAHTPWLGLAPHHFPSFARILAEVNGFRHTPLNGGFKVVK